MITVARTAKTYLEAYGVHISNENANELAKVKILSSQMDFLDKYENTYGWDRHFNRAGKIIGSLGTILGIGVGAYMGRTPKPKPIPLTIAGVDGVSYIR